MMSDGLTFFITATVKICVGAVNRESYESIQRTNNNKNDRKIMIFVFDATSWLCRDRGTHGRYLARVQQRTKTGYRIDRKYGSGMYGQNSRTTTELAGLCLSRAAASRSQRWPGTNAYSPGDATGVIV